MSDPTLRLPGPPRARPVPMSGEELGATLLAMRWTNATLAHWLGCDRSTCLRWRRGELAVPQPVAEQLRRIRPWFTLHPAPDWRVTEKPTP